MLRVGKKKKQAPTGTVDGAKAVSSPWDLAQSVALHSLETIPRYDSREEHNHKQHRLVCTIPDASLPMQLCITTSISHTAIPELPSNRRTTLAIRQRGLHGQTQHRSARRRPIPKGPRSFRHFISPISAGL